MPHPGVPWTPPGMGTPPQGADPRKGQSKQSSVPEGSHPHVNPTNDSPPRSSSSWLHSHFIFLSLPARAVSPSLQLWGRALICSPALPAPPPWEIRWLFHGQGSVLPPGLFLFCRSRVINQADTSQSLRSLLSRGEVLSEHSQHLFLYLPFAAGTGRWMRVTLPTPPPGPQAQRARSSMLPVLSQPSLEAQPSQKCGF